MTHRIGVDCLFTEDGAVRVRRVRLEGKWLAVEQGRQWADETGRHALVMFSDGGVREIILQQQSLLWEIRPAHSSGSAVV